MSNSARRKIIELHAEIESLRQQLASLAAGVKIQIPSDTLEQEFSSWHRRGYNKAKDEMHQEVERLKAELAGAKKDAARRRADFIEKNTLIVRLQKELAIYREREKTMGWNQMKGK